MRISRSILRRLNRALAPRRKPDVCIGGTPEEPYLLRWYVWPRNKWCNLYYHVFLRSDDDRALHDHPWPSVSLLLAGPIGEIYRRRDGAHVARTIERGQVVYRGAKFAHRLVMLERAPVAASLFLTGPVVREWGFLCPRIGWRHWRDFTKGAKGETIGKGCAE